MRVDVAILHEQILVDVRTSSNGGEYTAPIKDDINITRKNALAIALQKVVITEVLKSLITNII